MGKKHNDEPSKTAKGSSITFYINDKVIAQILKDAKDDKRSKSYIVNEILEQYYLEQGRLTD